MHRNLGPSKSFVLEEFFAGRTIAHAKFAAINGLRRKFRIDIDGVWERDVLKLNECFVFEDGERDTKTWEFRKISDGKYLAHRQDVVQPVKAIVRNNTMRYTYLLYLDPANRTNVVRFWDRITRVDGRTLKNLAIVMKFGIPVGYVTGVFLKQDEL